MLCLLYGSLLQHVFNLHLCWSSLFLTQVCCLENFTISKISGSFVRISHTSKKYLNLPAIGRFGILLQKTSCLPMDEYPSDRLKELWVEKKY